MIERLVHGAGYWGWRLAAGIAQRLPARPLYGLAVALGELGYVGWTTKRRIAKHNFSIVLGRPPSDREVARVKGSGLGLFIVRSIAKKYGGKAFAESEGPGRGATITIQLPRAI